MVYCNDCKYAQWEARLFAEMWTDDIRVHYYTEQFDCHCTLRNEFFLEYDEPDCRDGVAGENNLMDVCRQHERLRRQYNRLLERFRAVRRARFEISGETDDVLEGSDEEFTLWTDYLKEREPELYKEFNRKD